MPTDAGPLPFDACDLTPEAIAARMRWARTRGHPGYLWPDVPMPAWRVALAAIERATTALLVDPARPARLELPATASVKALGVAAYTSGLGPLLGYWIEAGRLEADPDAAALLALHLAHGRRRAERLSRELVHALDVLSAAGLRPLVLKGTHTARAYFPEPGTRPTSDIDLAVAPAEAGAANRSLAAAGYVLKQRQPQLSRWDWVPPDAPTQLRSLELSHADDPCTIDLHASLDRNFFGVRTVSLGDQAGDRTRPWPAIHPAARVLRQPYLAAYLAAHASEGLHNLTLVRLVELVLVVRADVAAGELRWEELHALLEARGALRFAYPAFELAERLAPGTIDPGLRAALASAATPRMTRIIRPLRPSAAQRLERLSLAERFMWGTGPMDHLRRALEMAWPRWARSSPWRLPGIYAERIFRLLRGRVAWRGASRR